MKKLFYLFIGGIALLMSCATDYTDDAVTDVYKDTGKLIEDMKLVSSGTYDMAWIVNKQVVDTATLSSKDNKIVISHFPVEYLYRKLLGGNKMEHTIPDEYYEGRNPTFEFTEESYWSIKTSFVGVSTGNAYYANNTSLPGTTFQMDGKSWYFIPEIRVDKLADNPTSLMYDYIKDVWSGAVNLDSCFFVNRENLEINRYGFNPPLTLSFQTTGKKQK